MERKKENCYHKWKYSGKNWCQACGEFDSNKHHGTPVSICTECGQIFEPEFGYLSEESIKNLISIGCKIPNIQ